MSFLDRLLRSLEQVFTGGGFLDEPPTIFYRKFVSGLFYCSGSKRNYYALTYEDNETDRELDLLSELEFELESQCSNMRDFHGYEQEETEDNPNPQWPQVEIGVL